jgi:cation diffusion facilitator family transporter
MAIDEDARSGRRGEREKRRVALSSVIAAVFLTGMKLVVGLLTGSLGILSEAAHSGLDLVAAAVTLFAVRVSGRPADVEHTYGHGKIENLSALFETVLLLLTCVWIIYEAIQRLLFRPVEIQANLWSFLVMGISIVIDFSRSNALYRVARKYNSQALEADALHFSTDIWSSSVVIGGLALVRLSDVLHVDWLMKADAVAAMGVAGIVTYVSLQLGRRTIAALLDSAPAGSQEKLLAVAHVPGVEDVTRARLRRSGPEIFADLTLAVASDTTVEQAHQIASLAESSVREVMPGTDLVIHIEPDGNVSNGTVRTVQRLAVRHGLKAHGIRVYHASGYRSLELHLEVQDNLRLDEAHALATAFENELAETLPDIKSIVTHMEPVGEGSASLEAAPGDEEQVRQVLQTISAEDNLECRFYDLEVRRLEDGVSVSFRCSVDASTAVAEAHRLTERVERALRDRLPGLGRVVIHVEPTVPPNAS